MNVLIEESFDVAAAGDNVYAYLLQADKVISCMPGAELVEVVDEDTLVARLKIKVGAILARYEGKVEIVERDATARRSTLRAEAREVKGAGSARAVITMVVEASDDGSNVRLGIDYSVVGRLAQFGRGAMEDVARHLIGQMAECIRGRIETRATAGADGT